ncbi:hypothetical protein Mtc_1427 [Methanocella conradii HZ254]|uniref:Uncharacterized protein n=1 Tax=Methanocella conradii (strain DSM 24694 / JCM 17849 / CGMCC 1.5162 / HZ254) TaxID=1041930 RepID=H8I4K2_METCZ|nr:hypothetical protein Mtc_1427 [Methanocella conradii HZ254]
MFFLPQRFTAATEDSFYFYHRGHDDIMFFYHRCSQRPQRILFIFTIEATKNTRGSHGDHPLKAALVTA